MLDLADSLIAADKMKAAIDAAPLGQRVTALIQLTDRIIKLAAQLPAPEDRSLMEELLEERGDNENEEDEISAGTTFESNGNSAL
jgi:hypothetical protein